MVDALYLGSTPIERVYRGAECAWPEYENLSPTPVPTAATVPESKQWQLSGEYYGGDSTRTLESGDGPFGRDYLRKTITATTHASNNSSGTFIIGTNTGVATIDPASKGIPVDVGVTYTVSVYLRSSTESSNPVFHVRFWDATGQTTIGGTTSYIPTGTPLTPGEWMRLSCQFTVPDGTALAGCFIQPWGGTAVIGDTFDATCLMVSTDGLHPYRDTASPRLA